MGIPTLTESESNDDRKLPLSEWVDKHCPELCTDILCHLNMLSKDSDSDKHHLLRMIMVSIRDHKRRGTL